MKKLGAGRLRLRDKIRQPGKVCWHGAIACSLAWLGIAGIADASPRNDLGGIGMIEMPSARMAPDGTLSAGGSFFQNNQKYNLTFQVLPWLETSFRYSGLQHFDPLFPVYYDRAFAFKARLWDEAGIFPAVSVGVNDLVGTGFFSGEYVVASKRIAGAFDVTAGMGWGRLATANTIRNPLALISNHFENRSGLSSNAGDFSISQYFRGHNAGLFGGVVWDTPVENLALIVEYSSDAYSLESARGNFSPRSQVNIGASYRAFDSMLLGVNYLYGRTIGVSAAFELNPIADPYPNRIGPAPVRARIRSDEEQQLAIARLVGLEGRRQTMGRSAERKNALVDGLWASIGGLKDISVQGHALTIAVAGGGDAARICATVARLAGLGETDIDTVTLTGAGPRAVRCAVQAPSRLVAANTIYADAGATALTGLVMASLPVQTIDATAPAARTPRQAMAAIRAQAAKQNIGITALSLTDTEALVYYNNGTYFHESEAVARLVRILMAEAPPSVERFRLIAMGAGRPVSMFNILRSPSERSIVQTETLNILSEGNSYAPAPLQNPVLEQAQRGTFPHFSGGIFPQFRQQLFDPNNPFAVQFLAGAYGGVQLAPGLSINGEVEASLYDNFNVNRPSDSLLPHVRSDFVKYFTQGKNGIGDLEADYRFRLAPNVFAVARAGYLESMFAGAGGEVLWRPEGQRWALGFDAYEVWQRQFDRLFGLQNYRTFTGHVSLYYASPWYGLQFIARAGRYLAGDDGLTFEVTRRFESGVEIGAFFTKTNVSSARFGEGSFDKGIIIRLPLEFALPVSTQNGFGLILRPVQRDGGQRMDGDANLYEETRRASYAEIEGNADIAVTQ